MSPRSSAWLHAVCVQHESRETANGVTPACSNSALLSRRSSSSLVQVEDQAKRKKTKSAAASSTSSGIRAVSRGASQTVASGTWSPAVSNYGPPKARTASAWRFAAAGERAPAASSTTKALVPGKRWFCQFAAVPAGQRIARNRMPASCA